MTQQLIASGLPQGSLTLSLDAGGQEAIAPQSFVLPAPRTAKDLVAVAGGAPLNARLSAATATITNIGAMAVMVNESPEWAPILSTYAWRAAVADPTNLVLPAASEAHRFSQFAEGHFDGARLDIYRGTGAALIHVGTKTVDRWRARGWTQNNAFTTTATSFTRGVSVGFLPNDTIWFGVAAVMPDGTLGPYASVRVDLWASWSPSSSDASTALGVTPDLDPGAGPALTGLAADTSTPGQVTLSWDAAAGVAGYSIQESDFDPATHDAWFGAECSAGPAIEVGDRVVLRKTFRDWSRGIVGKRLRNLSNRTFLRPRPYLRHDAGAGFELLDAEDFAGRASVTMEDDTDGRHYLRVPVISGEAGFDMRLTIANPDSATAIEAPAAGRTYRADALVRSDAPGTARITFRGGSQWPGGLPAPEVLATTASWQRVSLDITMPATLSTGTIPFVELRCAAGTTYDVKDFRFYDATDGRSWDAPPSYNDARVTDLSPSAYRQHLTIKTGIDKGHRLEDLLEIGLGDRSVGQNIAHLFRTCAHDTAIKRAADAAADEISPWLQIEPYITPEEIAGLVEYICAPVVDQATTPWAWLRQQQGQTAPWQDAFDTLYFELGNEPWNPSFTPWNLPAQTQARWTDWFIAEMAKSPHFERDRWLVIGAAQGATVTSPNNYAEQLALNSAEIDLITTAGYNGGWEEGMIGWEPDGPGFLGILEHAPRLASRRFTALSAIAEAATAARGPGGRPVYAGTYEGGPGYALPGSLNTAGVINEQLVQNSVAAGTSAIDSHLTAAALGARSLNMFVFQGGGRWSTHHRNDQGNHPHPFTQLIGLISRELPDCEVLPVALARAPRADLPFESTARPAIDDAPVSVAYLLKKGAKHGLVICSRRVPGQRFDDPAGDGVTTVRAHLPFETASAITLHRFSVGYAAETWTGNNAVLGASAVPVPPSLRVFEAEDAPPGQALVYIFER